MFVQATGPVADCEIPTLSTRQVAKALGLSVFTIRSWRRLKRGPQPYKLNPRVTRYKWADMKAFIAESQR